MDKKVFAAKSVTNVRELPSTESKIIATIDANKNGLYFIRVTPAHNGHEWVAVRLGNGKEGYVRRDAAKIVELRPTVMGEKRNKLKYLIIHCTATPESREVTKEDIVRWHTAPVSKGGRGWSKVGYSRLINLKGDLILTSTYNDDEFVDNWEITNGASGINSASRHIVYAGGLEKSGKKAKDTRNEAQLITMEKYIKDFVSKHPDILIGGHNQFANKACPSFDTTVWLKSIGVADKNIYKK
jgi:hypothetical protein